MADQVVNNHHALDHRRSVEWLFKGARELQIFVREAKHDYKLVEQAHFVESKFASEGQILVGQYAGLPLLWKEHGQGELDRTEHAVGAYILARALGCSNVLPTFQFDYQGRSGALELRLDKSKIKKDSPSVELQLFDLLSGNPDRSLQISNELVNVLIPCNLTLRPNEIWIDNEACFTSSISPKSRTDFIPHIITEIHNDQRDEFASFVKKLRHTSFTAIEARLAVAGISRADTSRLLENRDTLLRGFQKLEDTKRCFFDFSVFSPRKKPSLSSLDELANEAVGTELGMLLQEEQDRSPIGVAVASAKNQVRTTSQGFFAAITPAKHSLATFDRESQNKRLLPIRRQAISLKAVNIESLLLTGQDHSLLNLPCQDHLQVFRSEKTVFVAIADGFTSAQFSHLGARFLCNSFIFHANELVTDKVSSGKESILNPGNLAHLHTAISQDIKDLLKTWRIDPYFGYKNALASTLLGAIITQHEVVMLSIGDGFFRTEGDLRKIYPASSPQEVQPPSLCLHMIYEHAQIQAFRTELDKIEKIRQENSAPLSQYESALAGLVHNYDEASAFRVLSWAPSWSLQHQAAILSSDGLRYGVQSNSTTGQGALQLLKSADRLNFDQIQEMSLLQNIAATPDYFRINSSTVSKLEMLSRLHACSGTRYDGELETLTSAIENIVASTNDSNNNVTAQTGLSERLLFVHRLLSSPMARVGALAECASVIEKKVSEWASLKLDRILRREGLPSAGLQALHDDIALVRISLKR